jgi:hypothetical protein
VTSTGTLVFAKFKNTSSFSICKSEQVILKASAKNPSKYVSSGVAQVKLVSAFAHYIYETGSSSSAFATK